MRMFFAFVLLVGLAATPAHAIETTARQMILVDANTHTVMLEKNADEVMHPSSMSKLMTIYDAFSRLKDGRLHLTDTLPVSEKAWRTGGSKMFVELNNHIAVQDLLQGIIVQSGNDACVVMAEGLGGSEEAFAEELNALAKKIGLEHSHFVNSNGLPDPQHVMTARDLYLLASRIIDDFPEYYHFFSEKEFTYHGITQPNRNLLLANDLGVDGLKTGHTDDGGYGITISAKNKEGRRLILVINGTNSIKEREVEGDKLLRYGFREFDNVPIVKKGGAIDQAEVWMGTEPTVPLTVKQDLVVTLPKANREAIKFTLLYMKPLIAPLAKDAHVADLKIAIPGREPILLPLYAANDVEKLSPTSRIFPVLSHYLFGDKS